MRTIMLALGLGVLLSGLSALALNPTPSNPTISVQPQGVRAAQGSTVVLSVTASGNRSPLYYRWRVGTTSLQYGTNSTYTLNNIQDVDSGNYTVIVGYLTNSINVTTSSVAVVAVSHPPVITTISTNQIALPGDEVIMSVSAGGTTPFGYQWQKDGVPLPSETGQSLDINPVGVGDAGTYTIVVSNIDGVITSGGLKLTVVEADVVGNPSITNTLNTCTNVTLSAVVHGTDPALTYQWSHDGSPISGATSSTLTLSSLSYADGGVYQVDVTGVSGAVSAQGTITLQDPAPVIHNCPSDIVVQTGAANPICGKVVTWTPPTASDNCSVVSFVSDHQSGDTFSVGDTIVTYTATDNSNQVTTASFKVTVQDTTPPVVTVNPITVNLDSAGNYTLTAANITAITGGSHDNCGIAATNVSPTSFSCANTGANQVTVVLTDIHGNSATNTATVTVRDVTAPVVQVTPITVDLDAAGHYTLTAANVAAIAAGTSDACGTASTNVTPSTFGVGNVGANPVTVVVTDIHGNSATNSTVVTVRDVTPPTLVLHPISVALNPSGTYTLTGSDILAMTTGSSDAAGIISTNVSKVSFDCSNYGSNQVTVVVTDANSNSTTNTTVVTVTVAPPSVAFHAITVRLDATGNYALTPADYAAICAGSSSYCGIATTNISPSAVDFLDLGARSIQVVLTDAHGNSSTNSGNITVLAPIASPQTVYVDPGYGITPAKVTWPATSGTGAYFVGYNAFATIQGAVDAAGVGGTIHVAAGTYPEMVQIGKALTLLGAKNGLDAPTRFAAFLTGPAADPAVESVISGVSGTSLKLAADNIVVDGFVLDGGGAATRAIQSEDNTGAYVPVNNATIKNNIVQNYTERGIELVNSTLYLAPESSGSLIQGNVVRSFGENGIVLAFNAYANIISNTVSMDAGSLGGIWLQTYSLNSDPTRTIDISHNTVTVCQDAYGGIWANFVVATNFTLNVHDNVVNADTGVTGASDYTAGIYLSSFRWGSSASVANNSVGLTGGQFARGISLYNVETDRPVTVSGGRVGGSLKGVSMHYYDPNFGPATFGNGAATVTGVDISGNDTGVFVEAVGAPSAQVKLKVANSSILYNATGVMVDGGRALLEGNNLTANSVAAISSADDGVVDAGNCTSDVSGLGLSSGGNNLTGYLTGPAKAIVNSNTGVSPVPVLAYNDSFGATLAAPQITSSLSGKVLASQSGGLLASALTPVTTVFQCVGDVPVGVTTLSDFQALGSFVSATAATVSSSDSSSVPGPNNGTITRTYTLTDACGQGTTVQITFSVLDTIAPIISHCAVNTNIVADATAHGPLPDLRGQVVATDNCTPNPVITQIPAVGTVVGLGDTVVTLWASDLNGNSNSCTATVTVLDRTPPVLTIPANLSVSILSAKDPYATGIATATDANTFGPVVIAYTDNLTGLNLPNSTGNILRKWTAVDASSNGTTNTQTITVVDTNTPYFTSIPTAITVSNDLGNCSAVVNFTPVAWDLGFTQGFEDAAYVATNSANPVSTDWNSKSSLISRVVSGTDGVSSKTGSAHALINSVSAIGGDTTGAFTRLGGYSTSFDAGYRVSQDIYIDLSNAGVTGATLSSGYTFDLAQVVNDQAGAALRSFVFHAAAYDATGVVIAVDNTSGSTVTSRSGDLRTGTHYKITSTGWYTFEWVLRSNAGVLAGDLNLRDASGSIVFTQTLSNGSDLISTAVGGHGLLAFTFINVDKLPIDNTVLERSMPVDLTLASGTAFPIGLTTVTNSITDALGNNAKQTFTVTVVDAEKPQLTISTNIIQPVDVGQTYATVSFLHSATDNCGIATFVATPVSGSHFPIGTNTVVVVATDIHGNSVTNSFTVETVGLPVITLQPVSRTNNAGTTATFTVAATSPTALSYQWYKGSNPLSNGGNVSGATSATLTIATVADADVDDYGVKVTNMAGDVSSGTGHLTVINPPVITSNPVALNVNATTNVQFSVSVTGTTPFAYHWNKNGTPLSNSGNVSGVLTPTLSIQSALAADRGTYSVTITNPAGSVTSSGAALGVFDPWICIPPVGVTNYLGGAASFSVTATGTAPLQYNWQQNGTTIPSATNSTYSISSIKDSDAGSYTVVVTTSGGSVTNTPVLLGITHPPVIVTQPVSLVAEVGQSPAFSVSLTGATPFSYQWRKGGVNVPGITTRVFTLNNVTTNDAGSYDVVVTNIDGAVTSQAVSLSVFVAPVGVSVNATTNVQFGVTAVGASPFSYQWSKNGVPLSDGGKISGSHTNSLIISNSLAADRGLYTVTVSNSVASATSSNATLAVFDPWISIPPVGVTNYLGGAASFSVTATGTSPLLYQWRKDGVDIGGANASTYSIPVIQDSQAGAYTVVITTAGGSVTNTPVLLGITHPPVFVSQATNLIVEAGQSPSFTVNLSGTTPLSYQWRKSSVNIGGATSSTLTLSTVTAGDAGSYDVVVTNIDGTATSQTVTLSVLTPPSGLTVNASTNVQFSVTATGPAPFSYQWKKDGTPLVDNIHISGSQTATLSIQSALAADRGSYTVTVTNSVAAATTTPATLAVVDPWISVAPVGSTNALGAAASLSVAATGTSPLVYNWRQNGVNIPGATNSAYNITSLKDSDSGNYTVAITTAGGSITSAPVSIAVIHPPVFVTQPVGLTVNVGQSPAFSVSMTGTSPFGYQWQKSSVNISGATNRVLTLSNVTTNDSGSYAVVVTNVDGTATSQSATLTVIVPPLITTQPVGVTNNAGTTATLSVVADGTALTYQWLKNSTNILSNGGHISGATNATLTISGMLGVDTASYSVLITNVGGSQLSSNVIVSVVDPAITNTPGSLSVRLGSPFSLKVGAYGTSPTYQWRRNGTVIPGATSATLTNTAVADADAGSYDVVVTTVYGSATSAPASVLTVLDPALVVTSPTNLTQVAGTTASFHVSASGTAVLGYQWSKGGTPLSNGGNIGGATSDTLTITGIADADAGNYLVVVTNIVGTNSSASASLTVLNPPVIATQPASRTNAAGTSASFTVGATGTQPLGYRWFKGSTPLSDGSGISGAFTATLTISPVAPGDAGNYSVVVSNVVTTVTSSPASLTVMFGPSIVTSPASQTNNSSTTATFTVSATGSPVLYYQWTKGGVPLSDGGNISGSSSTSLNVSSLTLADAGNYAVIVTNNYGSATSSIAALTIIGAPLVTVQPVSITNNAQTTATFTVTASGSAPFGYYWYKNGTNLLGDSAHVSGSHTASLSISNVLHADIATYSVSVSNAAGISISSNATLTVIEPVLNIQPVNTKVIVGNTAVFTVTASGTGPLSYRWRLDGIDLTDGFGIAGSSSPTLSITNVADSDVGQYSVVVTNLYGSVTSTNGSLVTYQQLIVNQPVDANVLVSNSFSFSVDVNGATPFTYQWQKAQVNIPNATNRIYSVSSAALVDDGFYRVIVINPDGTQTSSSARLTVAGSAGSVITIGAGTPGMFNVTLTGVAGLHYTLQASTDLTSWLSISNGVSPFTVIQTNNTTQRFFRGFYVP